MEYGDYTLIRGIQSGDPDALEALIRRWYPRIFGYVLKMIGQEQDAYDVTQDIFIAMMQGLGGYRPWRKFDSWLFAVAHNKCMDHFRRRKWSVPAAEPEWDRPSPDLPVEDAVTDAVAVQDALKLLPDAQREAVILHYFHQFTVKEIARMTGAPLATVKSRLKAARKTLSGHLQEGFQ